MFFKDDNKVKVNQTSISTFIGADTKVEGTLITRSSVRIDGAVVGGVVADGTVVLSQSGQIDGNVMAENIIIAGVVDGNITIKDKTNIEPTGEVYGDINTSKILIDEQSVFQGKCNMNIDRSKSKKGKLKLKEVPAARSAATAPAPAEKVDKKPAIAAAEKTDKKPAATAAAEKKTEENTKEDKALKVETLE